MTSYHILVRPYTKIRGGRLVLFVLCNSRMKATSCLIDPGSGAGANPHSTCYDSYQVYITHTTHIAQNVLHPSKSFPTLSCSDSGSTFSFRLDDTTAEFVTFHYQTDSTRSCCGHQYSRRRVPCLRPRSSLSALGGVWCPLGVE